MKTKNKIIVIISLLLMMGYASAQREILRVDLVLHRDGTVELGENLYVATGNPTKLGSAGNYKVTLEDERGLILYIGKFDVRFLGGEPLRQLSKVDKYLKLPYQRDARKLTVYAEGGLFFEHNLDFLCKQDRRCTSPENAITCPEDCSPDINDGLCLPLRDEICDPDCQIDRDQDCLDQYCGNKKCDRWENNILCIKDCPVDKEDGYCLGIRDSICDPDCPLRRDVDCMEQRCPDGECFKSTPGKKEEEGIEAIKNLSFKRLLVYILIAFIGIYLGASYLEKRKEKDEEEDEDDTTRRLIRIQLEEGRNPEEIKTVLKNQRKNPKLVDEVLEERAEE
ncbi:hypothetical protein ACFLRC_03950 [Candidatus Altiarchaeota archaeon]